MGKTSHFCHLVIDSNLGPKLTKFHKIISFMERFSISIKTVPPPMALFFSLDCAD